MGVARTVTPQNYQIVNRAAEDCGSLFAGLCLQAAPGYRFAHSQYPLEQVARRMKIATYNINKRLGNLLAWLRSAKPDVVALQELKAADAEFPKAALEKAGYGAVWRGQKSWNGVAILARGCEPIVTRTELPGDGAEAQSRYIEAAVRGVLITSLYAPNGNPQPGPKFDYKLAWMERLLAHAKKLYGAGIPVVLAGDYNVVPTDH